MQKLPAELRQMIDQLCQKGDQFAQIDQIDDALDQYEAAWELLPSPKDQWPAATWILMAAGDVYFEKRNFEAASQTMQLALGYPDGDKNGFIWLRFGQSQFELQQFDSAADALETAIRLEGEELFADEDPKYVQFVKTHLGHSAAQLNKPTSRFKKRLVDE